MVSTDVQPRTSGRREEADAARKIEHQPKYKTIPSWLSRRRPSQTKKGRKEANKVKIEWESKYGCGLWKCCGLGLEFGVFDESANILLARATDP